MRVATLGDLERSVMDLLWASDTPLTSYELQAELTGSTSKTLAVTTVLTVLSRLEKKGFVARERSSRPHRYVAASTREDHTADLMHEVLSGAADRMAVLERFVGQASPAEAEALRKVLGGQ
jgi:predicted transcriptional regulator